MGTKTLLSTLSCYCLLVSPGAGVALGSKSSIMFLSSKIKPLLILIRRFNSVKFELKAFACLPVFWAESYAGEIFGTSGYSGCGLGFILLSPPYKNELPGTSPIPGTKCMFINLLVSDAEYWLSFDSAPLLSMLLLFRCSKELGY